MKLRNIYGVKNFKGDGPPTETSVSFMDQPVEALPLELWVALWNLSDLQELSFHKCKNLEALPS